MTKLNKFYMLHNKQNKLFRLVFYEDFDIKRLNIILYLHVMFKNIKTILINKILWNIIQGTHPRLL